jgi:hypothetical protein
MGHTAPMRLAALLCLIPSVALADDNRCVDVQFTPTEKLQIVAWVETTTGQYVDTLYITQQTGSFGLGNRPGRFDFNSGPLWPYGRRITTFPVWSHRHGIAFPYVMFQDDVNPDNTPFQDPFYCDSLPSNTAGGCGEYGLSHPFNQSSRDAHFCQPLQEHEGGWDAGTCATTAYTDKGRFSTDLSFSTGYPPRTDLARTTNDSTSVELYKMMNPFDAVSQPTPIGGSATHAPWAATMGAGDYVLYVETSKEFDTNASYNATNYPAPAQIAFSNYGLPYRGQPSVVYRVPFTVSAATTNAVATDYFGYGDPTGKDGSVRAPDTTITVDTPGSGGARLQLVSDGIQLYRVRVTIEPDQAGQPPAAPSELAVTAVHANDVSVAFLAPGIGTQQVTGYEVRVRAFDEMTAANFTSSMPVTAHVTPDPPGTLQSFAIDALLPETDYWIGVRAFDKCHNAGAVAITKVRTSARISGSVDACFVATAAYGSILANDVELLRHVRDSWLRTNALGELGVEAYYTFGPAFAGVIGDSELLRQTARAVLTPITARARTLRF